MPCTGKMHGVVATRQCGGCQKMHGVGQTENERQSGERERLVVFTTCFTIGKPCGHHHRLSFTCKRGVREGCERDACGYHHMHALMI